MICLLPCRDLPMVEKGADDSTRRCSVMTNQSLKRAVRAYQAEHGCSYSAAFHAVTREREAERAETAMSVEEFTEAVTYALNGVGVPAVAMRRDRVRVLGQFTLSLSLFEEPDSGPSGGLGRGLAARQVVRLVTTPGPDVGQVEILAEHEVSYRLGAVPGVVGFVKATLAQRRGAVQQIRQSAPELMVGCAWCGTRYPRLHLASPFGARVKQSLDAARHPGHVLDAGSLAYDQEVAAVGALETFAEVASGIGEPGEGVCPACFLDPETPHRADHTWDSYARCVGMLTSPDAPALWAGVATAVTAFTFEWDTGTYVPAMVLDSHQPAWEVLDEVPPEWWDAPLGAMPQVDAFLVAAGLDPIRLRLLPAPNGLQQAVQPPIDYRGRVWDGGMARLPERVRRDWSVHATGFEGTPPTAVPVWLPASEWLSEHAATPGLATRLRALGPLTSVSALVEAVEAAMPELMGSVLVDAMQQTLFIEVDQDDEDPVTVEEQTSIDAAILEMAHAIRTRRDLGDEDDLPEVFTETPGSGMDEEWGAAWVLATTREIWPQLELMWPALLTCAVTGCTGISEDPDRRRPWALLTEEVENGLLGSILNERAKASIEMAHDDREPINPAWDTYRLSTNLLLLWAVIPRLAQTLFPGIVTAEDARDLGEITVEPVPLLPGLSLDRYTWARRLDDAQ